jgi:ribonuclease HII
MMEHAPELISALQTLAGFLDDMGIPGLIALIMLGPSMMIIAVFVLDHFRQRHAHALDESHRLEMKETLDLLREIVEQNRMQTAGIVEQHRSDMENVLRDFAKKHGEVAQYYKDNVELVKTTQRFAIDMRDIVLNNTRAVEHLTNAMQANFYCPAAREAATGKK